MTDRELLEAAAKAAGIDLRWPTRKTDLSPRIWPGMDLWNPLADDGDALRLALDLGLVVDTSRPSAAQPFQQQAFAQADYTDQRAATRRAIVRAAAAMTGEGGKP